MNRYSDVVSGNTITLYRPVGQAEMDLIRMSGFREFPPRLPEQPFFYPVLNHWIPAADLPKMNANIIGKIEVLDEFRGDEQSA